MDAVREAQRKLAPISIFVSLKTQRLYVRQALEPVLEGPVTIRDPDMAIGTHIFTAMDYDSRVERALERSYPKRKTTR